MAVEMPSVLSGRSGSPMIYIEVQGRLMSGSGAAGSLFVERSGTRPGTRDVMMVPELDP